MDKPASDISSSFDFMESHVERMSMLFSLNPSSVKMSCHADLSESKAGFIWVFSWSTVWVIDKGIPLLSETEFTVSFTASTAFSTFTAKLEKSVTNNSLNLSCKSTLAPAASIIAASMALYSSVVTGMLLFAK